MLRHTTYLNGGVSGVSPPPSRMATIASIKKIRRPIIVFLFSAKEQIKIEYTKLNFGQGYKMYDKCRR